MFGLTFKSREKKRVAFCLAEKGYSVAAIEHEQRIVFGERREFAEKLPELIEQGLKNDVSRLGLVGGSCQLILAPGQYELVLMDALDMPKDEMAKALRWRLKGLVDYPLNDIAVDVFPIPAHGVTGQRKKVFVAVTLLSELKAKLNLFASAYLHVTGVGISELALRNLISFVANEEDAPIIAISFEESLCQLQIFYQHKLYLVRELNVNQTILDKEASDDQIESLLLEIQRSMDYCLSELKLPEVKKIIFTPSFYQAESLLQQLQEDLTQDVQLLDLRTYFKADESFDLQKQNDCFYSVGGALIHQDEEMDESDS